MGVLTPPRTPAETALAAAWDDARIHAPWRRAAFARFAKAGLPHRRIEAWRYTDLRALLRAALPMRAPDHADVAWARARLEALPIGEALRLVILDGAFRPDLSDLANVPDGVTVQLLNDALGGAMGDEIATHVAPHGMGDDDAMLALNAALMQDGVVVRVAAGAHVARPIAIVTLMSGAAPHAAFVRSWVELGDGARAAVVEINDSPAAAIQSHETLVVAVGAGAHCEHVAHVGYQGAAAMQVHSLLVTLGAHASFDGFCFVADGGLVRRQIFARLDGEYARIGLRGLSLLRGAEQADTTLVIDHAVPHGESREFFRHILDGEATGVYQGRVCVRQHAQKTDGAMKSQTLVLSDGASMFNKPELEIFADDVVCGHGATVGQLDDDQIFYLQARGLPRAEAQALLLEAFANEALDHVSDETLRAHFSQEARAWLARRSAGSSP